MNEKEKCCFCGCELPDMGNDPWPLRDTGRCCDKCNENVAEVRIALITMDNPD